MKRVLMGAIGARAIGVAGAAVSPAESARAQATGCRGRAEPVTTTVETTSLRFFPNVDFPGASDVRVLTTVTERVTTTRNYQGVEDLIFVVREVTFFGETRRITSLSIPAYLNQAYGGNEAALRADLEAGYLKDRGPCV